MNKFFILIVLVFCVNSNICAKKIDFIWSLFLIVYQLFWIVHILN